MILATAVSASSVCVSCADAVTSRSLTWFIQNLGGGGGQGLFYDFFSLYFDIEWHEVKIFQIRTWKGV